MVRPKPRSAAPLPPDSLPSDRSTRATRPTAGLIDLTDPILMHLASALDDFEKTRIRAGNRMRILTRPIDEADEDGEHRGFGLSPNEPVVRVLASTAEGLDAIENGILLELKRRLRTSPLYPWIEAQHGVGEKTIARLLGTIGDPYWHGAENRPRLVSELWAYCGLHGPHGRRKRGEVANWNTNAKTRAFLVIESCVKLDGKPDKNGRARKLSPYRAVYDAARVKYADKIHSEVCVRCGPSGKPAQPGSPWSDAHKHHGAIRIAMKTLLKDLWLEAKKIHESERIQVNRDLHSAADLPALASANVAAINPSTPRAEMRRRSRSST